MKIKFLALLMAAVFAFSGVSFASTPTIPAMFDNGTLATYNYLGTTLQSNVVVLGYSNSKNIYDFKSAFIHAYCDVDTPAAALSAAASWAVTDIITLTAHGYTDGLKGQVTSSGTKPTGISLATDYFIRVLSVDTVSLYDTYAHAIDTANTTGLVDITNIGSGNHTFTPTSIAGGTISLQGSSNCSTWVDITSSSSNVTADASFYWNIDDTFYPCVRIKYVNTAGTFTPTAYWAGKSRP